MEKNPSVFESDENPAENVSWDDAQTFIAKMNDMKAELKLCLPTEAQWEYACRAETTSAFNFEGELSLDKVNYRGIWGYGLDEWGKGALKQTTSVKDKKYRPNAWGLYQMHGNVWEWCQDWYGEYSSKPIIDPRLPESGADRVLRGGSWFNDGRYCRSAYRLHGDPSNRINIGFRLARSH